MMYAVLIMLTLLNLVWLAMVLMPLPGNWLMILSTSIVAWYYWDQRPFSIYTLIAAVILAILGEVAEFFGGMGGARKKGAGFFGSVGALLGALVGGVLGTFMIPLPLVGTLLGACGGAAGGAMLMEMWSGRDLHSSLTLGLGAGAGQFVGTMAKLAVGSLIWLIFAVAAFWP